MHPTSDNSSATRRIITIQPEPVVDNMWVDDNPNAKSPIIFGEQTPYPIHIAEDGKVEDQDFWQGDPFAIVGFQKEEDVQKVDLWWADVVNNPESAVGMFPVFVQRKDKQGTGLYTYTVKVESVSVREVAS